MDGAPIANRARTTNGTRPVTADIRRVTDSRSTLPNCPPLLSDLSPRQSEGFPRAAWADYLAGQPLASSTTAMYRALGIRLADHIIGQGFAWDAPTPSAVRVWSDTLATSRSMRDQARATVRLYARWCGLDGDELRLAVWRPASAPKPRWRSLPPATVRDLLAAADGQGDAGTAVYLATFAGLRRSEVAGVTWDRIDFEQRLAEVWRPKGQDWHVVPLAPALLERLAQRAPGASGWLFPGRWGGHVAPATISTWVKRVAELAGHPDVTPHALRHTAATELYRNTRDLVLAQTFLGHSRAETTGRYVRPSQAALADAVAHLTYAA